MTQRTCCVTGHRDIPQAKMAYVAAELEKEIRLAITDGYTRFISGFAEGIDLTFAAIVARLKAQDYPLALEAAIPYAGRLKSKDPLFQKMLAACDDVKVLSDRYSPECFFTRNRYMVAHSSRVLAIYDGRASGGTLYTIRYAQILSKDIRLLRV